MTLLLAITYQADTIVYTDEPRKILILTNTLTASVTTFTIFYEYARIILLNHPLIFTTKKKRTSIFTTSTTTKGGACGLFPPTRRSFRSNGAHRCHPTRYDKFHRASINDRTVRSYKLLADDLLYSTSASLVEKERKSIDNIKQGTDVYMHSSVASPRF